MNLQYVKEVGRPVGSIVQYELFDPWDDQI